MSDKSFGDYANRNIVKNPLLSTAVTGLSFEDLTHNAVLVPVAPHQGEITRPDTGTHTQTLVHTNHEHTSFPSGDSSTNMLIPQHPMSTYSHALDHHSQIGHHFDKKSEIETATVSKASAKTEDDFDVNEYFARLQGTRYVSAPLHYNLTETEDNLEEINLNDDKTQEVQQSLTADIAQNFSQLPNVLPHVASAVFSSFSNMWSTKSREHTPDDRAQNYQDSQYLGNQGPKQMQSGQGSQIYQDVQFKGMPGLNQFENQELGGSVSGVPLVQSEDVVKEVAPPPKEPPICGTSNFRMATTKKKYAQIPGLSTGETQPIRQIAFNPLTQNVPSYFIPTEDAFKNFEETFIVEHSINVKEQAPVDNKEHYNIFTPIDDTKTTASDYQPNVFVPADNHPKLPEETPPSINLQNPIPDIPPPPMFSTQRKENPAGKSILPPSVARRIGSKHPVIKQQTIQQTTTDNMFVPTFDPTPTSDPYKPSDNTTMSAYSTKLFAPSVNQPAMEIPGAWPMNLPAQMSQQSSTPPKSTPPRSTIELSSLPVPQPTGNVLPIFDPTKQLSEPAIFTPFISESTSNTASSPPNTDLVPSSAATKLLLPSTNVYSSYSSASAFSADIGVSTDTNESSSHITATEITPLSQPPKTLVEPPKTIIASSFRMTKKRPQYYSGPIEGIGSISNSIKPIIPTVESGTFHGALFTPEQLQTDASSSSFDINQSVNTETAAPSSHFEVATQVSTFPMPFTAQESTFANYNMSQPYTGYGEHYNATFDLSRASTESYEPKEDLKESKGFGIIGSLKSKLSNIDINKIQSSVTTFFDPGYNITKKDDSVTQGKQYNTQPQSNIEIFVPSVQHSIPYTSHVQDYQNICGQTSNVQPSQYNYQRKGPPLIDQAFCNQYSNSYYSDPTQNQDVSNIYFQGSTGEVSDSSVIKLEDKDKTNVQSQTKDPSKHINDMQTEVNSSTQAANCPAVQKTQLLQNFFQPDIRELHTDTKQEEAMPVIESNKFKTEPPATEASFNKLSGIIPCPGEYKDKVVHSSLGGAQALTDPKTLFENSNLENLYSRTGLQEYPSNMPYIPTETKTQHDNQVISDNLGYGFQDVGSLPIHAFENKKQEINSGMSPNIESKVKETENNVNNDNLLQSLSKDEVPILGVSSVPLFGLSTIVPKEHDGDGHGASLHLYERVRNKDIIDKNACLSFFENVDVINQKDHDTFEVGDIIDINQNLQEESMETKEQEYDIQISSAGFFPNEAKSQGSGDGENNPIMVDGQINLFENVGTVTKRDDIGLNEESVLVREEAVNYFKEVTQPEDIEKVSELNICETCREVNKPEEQDIERDNLTMQLIENITSPIQLLNPVEVPLTEDNNSERVEFDAEQFEEISHITEETIETIHVQSANELLEDDNFKTMNYGWMTNENMHSFHQSNPLKYSEYAYQVNPNALDFFVESQMDGKVPTNASDELKAEFKHQDVILPREMNIPSAPPAEEDTKSDEGGILDVNSIELDAKEDFPIYEEFVIEPSKTDDDKIVFKEREKTEESELDSFTNRVEKFKKMEEEADTEENKSTLKFHETHNQPISMASYFDTGNYAADTHYRNTLNSPSNISIPPGFEVEFKKRLALAKEKEHIKTVPETSTQTKPEVSITTAQSIMPVSFNSVSSTASTLPFGLESAKTPESSIFSSRGQTSSSFVKYEPFNVLRATSEISEQHTDVTSTASTAPTTSPIGSVIGQMPKASMTLAGTAEIPKATSIFDSQGVLQDTKNLFASTKPDVPEPSSFFPSSSVGPSTSEIRTDTNAPPLPDPMNFFDDSSQPASETVNRLASYFSSPPKTEHVKSFFELSQSQNHYKHVTNTQKYEDLIKDLTSIQNLAVPSDQTVRHVNYFTVEYNDAFPEFSKAGNFGDILIDSDDKDLVLLNSCKYCIALIYDKNYKLKRSMNNNTENSNAAPIMETSSSRVAQSVTVNFDPALTEDTNDGPVLTSENRSSAVYSPVNHHWFYRVDVEDKSIWRGFSVQDSMALENMFLSPELNESTVVPTDGGRYDVNLMGRLRIPVYWSEKPSNVRRCSWFYKGTTDPRYVPYTEAVAEKLEEEYWHGIRTGEWHRRLVLPNGEVVVMHGPTVMVHFLHSDAFSSPPQSSSRPRVVRRGHDDSEIEDAEPSRMDHLLLLCQGVGSACDMKFRSVEEVVEDFRDTSLQLVQSHYKNSYDQGIVNRVEVLPISWHTALHSGETGVDHRLAQITLESIPRLRNFTNDTVLDVLFYTSPVFCQIIVNTVCSELNRIYHLFRKRNPGFNGRVSLGGHSLGSVILYDLLYHQTVESEACDKLQRQFVPVSSGVNRPLLVYPKLDFEPAAFYALGSPIAIFECIRGVESWGTNFALPTCKNFFNIFHPYDPIAYRIEPLINPRLKELKPSLIPHHKGRKRMHLELKDAMARVGADLKQKLVESLKSTWNKWKAAPSDGTLERVVEEDLDREKLYNESKESSAAEQELATPEMLGRLNDGRRVDYVLQEAPLEMINEYLFAMSSHVVYWESEDTMLLMLREIYSALGVQPDSTVPQQSMTVQRTRRLEAACTSSEDPSTSGRSS